MDPKRPPMEVKSVAKSRSELLERVLRELMGRRLLNP